MAMPNVKLVVTFVISVIRIAKVLVTFQHKMSTSDAYRRRLEQILNRGSAISSSLNSANTNSERSKMTAVSTTPKDPIAMSEAESTLRTVKLSEQIRYLHCEEGHGIMTFSSKSGRPLFVKEVRDQDEFKLNYNVFRMMEDLI